MWTGLIALRGRHLLLPILGRGWWPSSFADLEGEGEDREQHEPFAAPTAVLALPCGGDAKPQKHTTHKKWVTNHGY